ncbi:MAG: TonB family protein [Spirochaetaceae bacterium]|jgi:protein TonB|nr:TonB family protein [Spirochaetaceae bacterium]
MAESRLKLTRLIIFLAVAALHLILIFFFVITLDAVAAAPEQPPAVMKLTDLAEEEPPPLPPPPPPPPEEPQENVVETIAENMIETEEVPPEQILAAPGTVTTPPVQFSTGEGEQEDYLPMHRISTPPVFSERDIIRALVYPPIALRSGLEGMVYLELFIDREGAVKRITVLRETPPDRGFGEAAVKAFDGLRCKPAEANGQAVAVRYRYPVRFTIRG